MTDIEKEIVKAFKMGWKEARVTSNREIHLLESDNFLLKKELAKKRKFIQNIKHLLS